MPVIKIDTGRSGAKVGRYLSLDRKGEERCEAFCSNTAAGNVKQVELQFRATRESYGKTEGREFFQAYISFQRDDRGFSPTRTALRTGSVLPDMEANGRIGSG